MDAAKDSVKRVKVINEATELVPVLRALDTAVKKEVFKEVLTDWKTADEIDKKFGDEGIDALKFFEKIKLVEAMWQTGQNSTQVKAYRSYYLTFHINTSCPIYQIAEIFNIAILDEGQFEDVEDDILGMVGDDGIYAGDVCEKLSLTTTELKSIVKRSSRLEYRGQRLQRSLSTIPD